MWEYASDYTCPCACVIRTHRCMGSPFLKSVPDPETEVKTRTSRYRNQIYIYTNVNHCWVVQTASPTHIHTDTWCPLGLHLKIDSFARMFVCTCEEKVGERVSSLTSVAEQLAEQRVSGGDHRRGLRGQLIEQPGYGGHSAPLCRTQPRRHGQTGQVARQRHCAQHL